MLAIAAGEQDGLPRVQNGKPRGQHGSNEGNQVVGEVGSGEEVGALYEGEQVVGELGVAADGTGDTGSRREEDVVGMEIASWRRHWRTRS